jgi:hypothetical protein
MEAESMQRPLTALAIVGLLVAAVPAEAQTNAIEEDNRDWVEDRLGFEADEDHPIVVRTDRGEQTRSAAWLVDRLADRFTEAGLHLSGEEASASTADTGPGVEGFPVANSIMLVWERVEIEQEDDDPRRRSLGASSSEDPSCSQGGGEAGGHYSQAQAVPEEAQTEIYEPVNTPKIPLPVPITGTSWQGAGSYDYAGYANSTLSLDGEAEITTFAPTLDATVGSQTLEYEESFTYESEIVYGGSSDFYCVQYEDPFTGDEVILNAPLVDGVAQDVSS